MVQKNLRLFEDLIIDNSNEGDLVLDTCVGSGTTIVACKNLNRDYLGFELDKEYYYLACKRIGQEALSNE